MSTILHASVPYFLKTLFPSIWLMTSLSLDRFSSKSHIFPLTLFFPAALLSFIALSGSTFNRPAIFSISVVQLNYHPPPPPPPPHPALSWASIISFPPQTSTGIGTTSSAGILSAFQLARYSSLSKFPISVWLVMALSNLFRIFPYTFSSLPISVPSIFVQHFKLFVIFCYVVLSYTNSPWLSSLLNGVTGWKGAAWGLLTLILPGFFWLNTAGGGCFHPSPLHKLLSSRARAIKLGTCIGQCVRSNVGELGVSHLYNDVIMTS